MGQLAAGADQQGRQKLHPETKCMRESWRWTLRVLTVFIVLFE